MSGDSVAVENPPTANKGRIDCISHVEASREKQGAETMRGCTARRRPNEKRATSRLAREISTASPITGKSTRLSANACALNASRFTPGSDLEPPSPYHLPSWPVSFLTHAPAQDRSGGGSETLVLCSTVRSSAQTGGHLLDHVFALDGGRSRNRLQLTIRSVRRFRSAPRPWYKASGHNIGDSRRLHHR